MNKRDQERKHFKKRLLQRYNLTLTDTDCECLIGKIKNNDKKEVKFLAKQSNRITVHLVVYKNTEIVLVYDKMRKQIVTALPPECKEAKNIFYYSSEMDEF